MGVGVFKMPDAGSLLFVVVQSWTGPIGKLLITRSYGRVGSVWRGRWLWRVGMLFVSVLVPLGTVAAYSVCPRAFVGPIHSTEALINCFLAWRFTDEGRTMGIETVRGVVLYAIGLVLLALAYTRHLSSTTTDVLDWGRFVFLTGAMMAASSVCVLMATAESARGVRSPWKWVVACALWGGYDYVVGADTWLVGGSPSEWSRATSRTWTEGVALALFVCASGMMSVSLLEQLLARYPLHVVAPAVQALEVSLRARVVLW